MPRFCGARCDNADAATLRTGLLVLGDLSTFDATFATLALVFRLTAISLYPFLTRFYPQSFSLVFVSRDFRFVVSTSDNSTPGAFSQDYFVPNYCAPVPLCDTMLSMKEAIKKKNILNLIKYYSENNDAGFRAEAYDIARYFNSIGDTQLAEYIMATLSGANTFTPQEHNSDMPYFVQVNLNTVVPLPLPVDIKNDIMGVMNSIRHGVGIHKFLFEGAPGTGKTESVKQIARILERSLYMIDFDSLISSRLGETQKNISAVFEELKRLPQPENLIILVDEIDAIALDRVNSHDVREMGRVTSSFLKGMDGLDERIIFIATTNLYEQFDKALSRRFDAVINFNRYSKEDLVDVAEVILSHLLEKFKFAGRNMRLFRKILSSIDDIPYPGDLKNIIKTALAFSDPGSEYDYLKKIYETFNGASQADSDIKKLKQQGYTLRETEVITGMSKSQVARELSA